jgi:hypothetical protein
MSRTTNINNPFSNLFDINERDIDTLVIKENYSRDNCFVYDNENDGFYDVAFIPDYKTSVMMNGLFRNIKENIKPHYLSFKAIKSQIIKFII